MTEATWSKPKGIRALCLACGYNTMAYDLKDAADALKEHEEKYCRVMARKRDTA